MNIFSNIFSSKSTPPVRKTVYRNLSATASYQSATRRKIRPLPRKTTPSRINKKAYSAARQGRLYSDWLTGSFSQNWDIRHAYFHVLKLARDLVQNDPLAKKFMRMIDIHAVGPDGFNFRNKSKIDEIDKKIRDEYIFAGRKENCTITGKYSRREEHKLLLKHVARDGEVFVLKVRGRNINKYGYSHKIIRPELCDYNLNAVNPNTGNVIFMGVELNLHWKPVAYWFNKFNPVDELRGLPQKGNHIRIPAESVFHLFVSEDADQIRGISWFAPVATRLKMLNKFNEAALILMRVAASKTLTLVHKEGHEAEVNDADIAGGESGTENGEEVIYDNVSPGETYVVPPGLEPWNYDPSTPNNDQYTFVQDMKRDIASGFGVSFINLANDYSQVNYTSSRTNLLEERDVWRDLHNWFIEHYLFEDQQEWLESAIIYRVFPSEWLDTFDEINVPQFRGRIWPWVDIEKEAKANGYLIENNLLTLEDYYDSRNQDWEEKIDQRIKEVKKVREGGIEPVKKNTKEPAKPEDDGEEDVKSNGKHKNYKELINQEN